MPSFLGWTSGRDVPVAALLMTGILIQAALFSSDAFTFMLKLCRAITI